MRVVLLPCSPKARVLDATNYRPLTLALPLPKTFWEQLPRKTDLELYEVLRQRGDYLPEALAAVKAEMQRRNLSSSERMAELAAASTRSRERLAQMEACDREQRHFAKFTVHVFCLFFAVPLALLIKWLVSLFMGP